MSLRLLLILSDSLEILAGFLALISPPPVDGIAAVLTRPFGAWCSRWDGLPESPRRCPESCRSGGEFRIISQGLLAAVDIFRTATGSELGGLLSWGAGVVHTVFGVLFLPVLAGTRQ